MRGQVVCMGEALIDFLPVRQQDGSALYAPRPGGAPFNAAVGLARMGVTPAFVGVLSTDYFGETLWARAMAEGIDTRWTQRAEAQTTLAFVTLGEGELGFEFYGGDTADTRLDSALLPQTFYEETGALLFGGVSLLRGETPAAVEAVVGRLAHGALRFFDPNPRPALVQDAVTYRARLARLFRQAEVVKLSAADMAWLDAGSGVEAQCAAMLDAGAALVLVTLGAEGALAARRVGGAMEMIRTDALAVTVRDTVGAGDAFSAAFLAQLAQRGVLTRAGLDALNAETLAGIQRFAVAAAALACTREGADPPTRAQVAALLGEA